MNRTLTVKLGMIGVTTLILLVVIHLIAGTVDDRQGYQAEAKHNVTASWTGHQEVLGPILSIPYRVEWQEPAPKVSGALTQQVRSQTRVLYLLPKTLLSQANAKTDIRRKGIFAIPVYETALSLEGLFEVKINSEELLNHRPDATLVFGQPTLSIGIRDARGLENVAPLQFGGKRYEFLPGSQLNYLPQGLHAPLDFRPEETSEFSFSTTVSLRGLDRISFQPAARNYQLTMTSDWPHPAFTGNFLPRQHEISSTGFQAEWFTHEFSSNLIQLVEDCAALECLLSERSAIGVEFMEPIDIYAKSERAVKYGILFIGLVFATFFVFETLKRLSIHPIQYGLVGLAICLFYLLLVSLSEHLAFSIAYLVGSIACIGLITTYLRSVLRSIKVASGFAVWLTVIYGLLYVIISAEDFALMMGSLLLFVVLAVLMISTRHVNWYEIDFRKEAAEDGTN